MTRVVMTEWADPLDHYSASFLQSLNKRCKELREAVQQWKPSEKAPRYRKKHKPRNRLDVWGEVL